MVVSFSVAYSQNKAVGLKCDHLQTPIGIDNATPRLSWMMNDSRQGAKQTAWQIIVGKDSSQVARNVGNSWDSKKNSSDKILVTYSGETLEPFTRYFWKVNIWDKDGEQSSSQVTYFETGMMDIKNWQGNWIGDGTNINKKEAPYFRKTFETGKTIKSARAYIAVAGLYELFINGERIGDQRLDPMYTRFDRKTLYVTHDVTSQLQTGKNAIGVVLGNGWYNHQSLAVWNFENAPWRGRPTFCFDLRITYTDGTEEVVKSDLDWRTSSGPIIFNSIYTAEHYDARLDKKDWATPSFDEAAQTPPRTENQRPNQRPRSAWGGVGYRGAPSPNIVSQQLHPIRNVVTIPAGSIKQLNDTTYIFDFERNMSGVTKIKVSGKEGTVVKLKHGERLYDNGHIDMRNIDVYFRGDRVTDPFQTDIVILSGNEDEFMAKFNYKGFRYVEVTSSNPIDLDISSLTAYFMHSDVPPVGEIKTSNKLIDRLWWATNNAYLSNFMGIPTDCPQREKNGWTGDAHFAIETALYNFDGITVYEKWLGDHRDEQQPNGVLPDIIPTGGWGYGTENGLDWTSTIAIIPWEIYMFYGDSKLLSDCYENIKRYVDYVDRRSPEHLTSWGRGDWVPVKSRSSKELTSSIYFYVDAKILANAAKLFDKQDDYEHYTALSEKIKAAINNKYLNKEAGIYASGTQTELSTALQWKIVPEDMIAKVAQNLAKKVEEAGFHLDVGVLGAKALLNALSENGYAEAAYKVAAQDKYPSWGWWIVNGATTLLENWDLDATRDISDNHMMFGEIGGWLFKGLGGIFPDPEQPGFKHIILKPNFVGLTQFEAKHKSPYGTIVSGWEVKKKQVTFNVEIPANSTATFYLPENIKGDKRTIDLESGKHSLKLEYKK